MARDEVMKAAFEGVKLAKSYCNDVEFSPEDASRTDHDFLIEIVNAAIEAGATTINIPDTVGYTIPGEFRKLFDHLIGNCTNPENIVFSVHCHDDLGLAVANSLAALEAGARQVECTINGIGERAGNTSLEEICMAIKTRKECFEFETQINTKKLYPTSRLVSSITGMHVPRNKAIVGENAHSKAMAINKKYVPNKLLLGSKGQSNLELLQEKLVQGKTMIYVCEHKICQLPTVNIMKAQQLMK